MSAHIKITLNLRRCIVCGKIIWPWQSRPVINGELLDNWHHDCYAIWIEGYNSALEFIDHELKQFGLPGIEEIESALKLRCHGCDEKDVCSLSTCGRSH